MTLDTIMNALRRRRTRQPVRETGALPERGPARPLAVEADATDDTAPVQTHVGTISLTLGDDLVKRIGAITDDAVPPAQFVLIALKFVLEMHEAAALSS